MLSGSRWGNSDIIAQLISPRIKPAMLFNSFSYLIFLPIVFILYWLSPAKYRKILLLVASYFFYMSWKAEYGLLMFMLTLINFGFGWLIDKYKSEDKAGIAKNILIFGIISNLVCLCFYKYANLLLETVLSALHISGKILHVSAMETWSSPALNIILPLGISFFTFEFIHYIVDVHRGSKPIKNFIDFALFASFFPSQISGPIKRFQDFYKQMFDAPKFQHAEFREGVFLILQGLFKKVVLGDHLGMLCNLGFSQVGSLSVSDAWISMSAFYFQVFFDFSGYTDIGRGSAMLLGYKVPENFNLPYLSVSPTEFWRRWHISLSTWLRDYLFIPLGGSRGGEWLLCRNLFITMALGGLWHGAGWHFMVWGGIHGIGLIVARKWAAFCQSNATLTLWRPSAAWHWSGIIYTILFVSLSHVVFRSTSVAEAGLYYQRLFNFSTLSQPGAVTTAYLTSTLFVTLPLYSLYSFIRHKSIKLSKNPSAALFKPVVAIQHYWNESIALRLVTCVATAWIIAGCAPSQLIPFFYFQF